MSSHEVFYLHIQGEQRGPYTIRHIDQLLNSGLIAEDTLFWREGLEQWQPVTNLVARRQPQRRWKGVAVGAAIAVVLALLLHLFGPITLADGGRRISMSSRPPQRTGAPATSSEIKRCQKVRSSVSMTSKQQQ
jgi:hypothetical protein